MNLNRKSLLKIKRMFLLSLFCVMGGLCFTSCEETAEIDEYANWRERNEAFIDSIAEVTKANADGKWQRILSFKLNETNIDGNPIEYDNKDYIYCHFEEEIADSVHPLFTDTVLVNYRGRLIPTFSYPEGKVFDQSYKGELNPATSVPTKFSVGGVIVGWSTALQHMTKGDRWTVYIPAELGYEDRKQTDIPAYSTLVFDINLVNFSHIGAPTPNM